MVHRPRWKGSDCQEIKQQMLIFTTEPAPLPLLVSRGEGSMAWLSTFLFIPVCSASLACHPPSHLSFQPLTRLRHVLLLHSLCHVPAGRLLGFLYLIRNSWVPLGEEGQAWHRTNICRTMLCHCACIQFHYTCIKEHLPNFSKWTVTQRPPFLLPRLWQEGKGSE